MLPGRQLAAQLPAGLSGLFIGRIIGDQARFVIQVGARRLAAAAPLPHPLAVAPAVGAEQGDLLSAQRALQSGEHGLHFVLLQLLGAHGGAAEGHDTKFRKPGGRELPRGQHGDLRTGLPGAVCDAVGHGLRVAGTAPVYDG